MQIVDYKNNSTFNQLKELKLEIEQEIGEELVWDNREEVRVASICLVKNKNVIVENTGKWEPLIDWAVPRLPKLVQVFKKKSKDLI